MLLLCVCENSPGSQVSLKGEQVIFLVIVNECVNVCAQVPSDELVFDIGCIPGMGFRSTTTLT